MVCGRGTPSILRARGRWLAWSSGPSTSPLESVRQLLRAALAFTLSPALGVLAVSLVLAVITRRSVEIEYTLLPIAYSVAVVVGVPAFLLARGSLPVPIWTYATVGLIAACFVSIPIMVWFRAYAWGLLALFAGAVSGLAFGLILGTDSNNRWRGP